MVPFMSFSDEQNCIDHDVQPLGEHDILRLTERDILRLINLGDQTQYEGNYQEATKKYLQALEIISQISVKKTQESNDKDNLTKLTSLRASILSKLGDNLVYVGHYKIATEFYEQQLRIVNDIGSKLAIAFAHHKIGRCHYYIQAYDSSIELQNQSLSILLDEEKNPESKQLECKVHFCLGLNQYALKNYEIAVNSYKIALGIARQYSLKNEEAEILIYLSLSAREKLSLGYEKIDRKSFDKIMGDLHYAVRTFYKNPYLKVLAIMELARLHEITDIDLAKDDFEEALKISKEYNLPFSQELQIDKYRILRKKQELIEQDYILEEQSWYHSGFPKTQEIDEKKLEALEFNVDFVIVTATPIELKAVLCLLEPCISEESSPFRQYTRWGTYYLGKFGHYKTAITQCRMGTRDERGAGFVTLKALEIWKPKAVIMVGIAFGKSNTEQKIGDVLLATEVMDYDVNRVERDKIIDRGSRPPSDRRLLDIFEQSHEWKFNRSDDSSCELISGPILSGDKLIDSPEFKAELFERFPNAKGGEMEGIGFCSAANSLQKPWILIKAICDWADGNKHDKYGGKHDKYQPLAAAAAASLVHYVLSQKTILNCFD
jgi:nucleoside phosphorylase